MFKIDEYLNGAPKKAFYTAQEVADLLQLNIATIYRYAREGQIATYKFGRDMRFQPSDIERFVNKHLMAEGEIINQEEPEQAIA